MYYLPRARSHGMSLLKFCCVFFKEGEKLTENVLFIIDLFIYCVCVCVYCLFFYCIKHLTQCCRIDNRQHEWVQKIFPT